MNQKQKERRISAEYMRGVLQGVLDECAEQNNECLCCAREEACIDFASREIYANTMSPADYERALVNMTKVLPIFHQTGG